MQKFHFDISVWPMHLVLGHRTTVNIYFRLAIDTRSASGYFSVKMFSKKKKIQWKRFDCTYSATIIEFGSRNYSEVFENKHRARILIFLFS